MKIIVLLTLAVLLPCGSVSAAPTQLNPHVPGDLARDRLQGMESILSPSEQVVLAQPGQSGTSLPAAQAKAVSARLVDLVSDDALYVGDAQYDRDSNSETLTVGEGLQAVTVSIRRDKPYLTIMLFGGNRQVIANYLPVLPKVVRLLQAVDPDDHGLSAFHPLPLPVAAAKAILASALARIATIKPGMTRADVLKVFTTEGGVSTTYWNHYVLWDGIPPKTGQMRGYAAVDGELIKANVDFAPRDADILWLHGRGFWLHQNDYQGHPHPINVEGQPDDIILRVSPPYLQYIIID